MSDVRVCRRDGEPLVFTMEFPGAEYVCGLCGGTEGVLGRRVATSPELVARLDALTEVYESKRAERTGRPALPAAPKVGDPGVEAPVCQGCGASPEVGTTLVEGKPRLWFSRTRDGETSYACRRSCIPKGEGLLPW